MASLVARNGRVAAKAHAAIAERGVGAAFLRVAVIGIDHMAAGAARIAVVAGIVVGPHEPHGGIVETRLGDVEDRDRDPETRRRAAFRLAQIGSAGLVELVDVAGRVRIADLGELRVVDTPAALEDAEYVGRRHHLPTRQRHQPRLDAVQTRQWRAWYLRIDERGGLAVGRVGFAHDRVLEGQDAVIVGARPPEHRGRRHQTALGLGNLLQVTGATGVAYDAVVARVREADKLGRFLVEQRIGAR